MWTAFTILRISQSRFDLVHRLLRLASERCIVAYVQQLCNSVVNVKKSVLTLSLSSRASLRGRCANLRDMSTAEQHTSGTGWS